MKYGDGMYPPSEVGTGAELLELWSTYKEEDRKFLLGGAFVKNLSRGEAIYKAGDTPQYFMMVRSGRVKIIKEGLVEGKTQIVRVLKPVKLFGYRAYLAGEKYVTSAYALDDCDIVFYPAEDVIEMTRRYHSFAMYLMKELSLELGFSDNRNISLTQKYVRGRLAETLLNLVDSCGMTDNGMLDVRLSREELAGLSNMTTSNAIRTLSAFAKEGLVELIGKRIVVVDIPALEEISRMG